MTIPIEYFTARLKDGRTIRVEVDFGEGYFKESRFVNGNVNFPTFEVFVANGKLREIPSFKAPSV